MTPGNFLSLPYFLRGLIIGFSIAAPVGPIGLLCIRRTLSEGRLAGFLSGMGAASADMLFGAVAAFGLEAAQDFLVNQSNWLRIVGGVFLLYLGIKTFTSKPANGRAEPRPTGLLGAFLNTFLLTLTNPLTILSFIAIFAGMRIGGSEKNYLSASIMVLGVFLGSATWWLTLSTGVNLFSKRLTPVLLTWINRMAGFIIFSFGILSLGSIF